jgi:hypothetical protein
MGIPEQSGNRSLGGAVQRHGRRWSRVDRSVIESDCMSIDVWMLEDEKRDDNNVAW